MDSGKVNKLKLAEEIYGEIIKLDRNTPDSVVFRMIRKKFNLNKSVSENIVKKDRRNILIKDIFNILEESKEIYLSEKAKKNYNETVKALKKETGEILDEKKAILVTNSNAKPKTVPVFKEKLKVNILENKNEDKRLYPNDIDNIIKNELCYAGRTLIQWKKIKQAEGFQEENIQEIANGILNRINELKEKLNNNIFKLASDNEDFIELFNYVLSNPLSQQSLYNANRVKVKRIWNESEIKNGKLSKIKMQVFEDRGSSFAFLVKSLENDKFFKISPIDSYNYKFYNMQIKNLEQKISILIRDEKERMSL